MDAPAPLADAAWFGQRLAGETGNESRRPLGIQDQKEQEGAENAEDDRADCVRESLTTPPLPSASSAISCSNFGMIPAEP